MLTQSQPIIQVRGHSQSGEAYIHCAFEAGLHAALEAGYLGSCGLRALPAAGTVDTVIRYIPLCTLKSTLMPTLIYPGNDQNWEGALAEYFLQAGSL